MTDTSKADQFMESSVTQLIILLGTAVGALVFVVKTILTSVNKQQEITNHQINDAIATLKDAVNLLSSKLDDERKERVHLDTSVISLKIAVDDLKKDTVFIISQLDNVHS